MSCTVADPHYVPFIDGATATDADTTLPIVGDYQPADLVVGQPTFESSGNPGCLQTSAMGTSLAVDNDTLYVVEQGPHAGNCRALMWAPLPSSNNASAARVLGQTNFAACQCTVINAASIAPRNAHVSAGDGKLAIADNERTRVMIWNSVPSFNGDPADLVLGQADFTTVANGNGAAQFSGLRGVWTDGSRITVADTNNHRVLIWTTFPVVNAQPADIVLGQPAFGMGAPPAAPTDSNLNAPEAVWSDGTRLVVADTGHNRVLVWTTFPTSNGEPADVVLGQADFTTELPGLSATAMSLPHGLGGTSEALFVADTGNDRVIVFSPFPTTNGEAARYVLGQPDLTTGANTPAATQQSLSSPFAVQVYGDDLWIADADHFRVLRFSLYPR